MHQEPPIAEDAGQQVQAADHPPPAQALPAPTRPIEPEGTRGLLLAWSIAGLCALTLHGGVAFGLLYRAAVPDAAAEMPAAIMIDLAPEALAPDAPLEEVAPGPQMVMSQAAAPAREEEAPEAEEVEPVAEAEMPALPQQVSEAMIEQPPLPQPKPEPEKPRAEARKPQTPRETRSRPQDRSALNAPATTAPQPIEARRANTNAAPSAGMSSAVAPATWRNRLVAHLNRHKRYPPGAGRGTATIAFTIGADGQVRSVRLARSSGDAALDRESLELARRASPVPVPPPNLVSDAPLLLAVPIRFGS
ncbi:energy transducer TonB [Xanthobacteraceae bacterium A53D]